MNKGDIFQKSALGREEIKNQHSSLLPREARTLLIFIDGKKTYQQYVDLLDKGKMFIDVGGIAPFFELLKDLEFIELLVAGNVDDPDNDRDLLGNTTTLLETDDNEQGEVEPVDLVSTTVSSVDVESSSSTDTNNGVDFDHFFDNQSAKPVVTEDSSNKRPAVDLNFEEAKSKLATYIEKNAPAQDVWSHMLNLEQCNNAVELIAFIQDIQRTDNSEWSQGINEFYTMLKQ